MFSFGAVLRCVASRHPQWSAGELGVGAAPMRELLAQKHEMGLLLNDLSELRRTNRQLQQQLDAAKQQVHERKRREEHSGQGGAAARTRRSQQPDEEELRALENTVLREQLLFFSATMPAKGRPRSTGNLSTSMPLPPV